MNLAETLSNMKLTKAALAVTYGTRFTTASLHGLLEFLAWVEHAQPQPPIPKSVLHATSSKMHSTSTAMFPGSGPMPTALRAPTPASSPNTSRMSSLKPLMTFGWS